jgi:CheY-like chemotaxis protein
VITLEFPIAAQGPANDRRSTSALLSVRRRFLLIDDDAESLAALKEALRLRGHNADTALSGAEGLEKIASGNEYDIVLCDLAMPGMNGWEVARVALATNGNLNFYITTGWGQEVQSHIPPDLPIRGVLSKPIDLDELERVVASITMRPGALLS